MTDQHSDKRRFSRIRFDAEALLSQDGMEWRSTLLDISLKGVMVKSPEGFNGLLGDPFRLEVIFADSGSLISGNVTIAHIGQSHIGFELTQIDVEGAGHLRRLVELNLGNPGLLDRELAVLHWR